MRRLSLGLVAGLVVGASVLALAQSVSSGGAFLPLEDITVSGVWTFRGASPIRFEGGAASADDAFELTLAVPSVTADTTLTLPTFGSAAAALLFSTLTTNDVDVANSIWGVSNGLRLEGATADAFETTLSPTDVGADVTLTLPGLGNASGAVLASSLTTNDLGVANSVWGVSNGLTFEGATADAGELFLTVSDIATASRTMTLPDMGAASAVLASTLTTNTVGAANSVWGVSNGLTFEGLTADAGELFLTVADIATASRTMTLPDMGAASALLASTLTTNTVDAANSVWGTSNNLVFEGATADAFETFLTPVDATADTTISLPNAAVAIAMVFSTLTTNNIDAANALWFTSNSLVWEGATADGFETTFTVADPGADATLTFTAAGQSAGEQLQTDGSGILTWEAAASSRAVKHLHGLMTPADGLAAMLAAPVYRFQYKQGQEYTTTGDYQTEYVGILAEDAPWAMHHHGKILNPVNTFGYSVLAIQALEARLRVLEARLAQ